jgi:hypothetical protein
MSPKEFSAMIKLASNPKVMILQLQDALRQKFGAKAVSDSGQCTLYIGPNKVDLTNEHGTIVARGPARVATVLVRKRRPNVPLQRPRP